MRLTALVLAVVGGTTACAPGRVSEPPVLPGDPAVDIHGISVEVENNRPYAMQIWATRQGMRFMVGEVGPRTTSRFELPAILLRGAGELRLEADPFGSSLVEQSDPIVLAGGRQVQWRLRAGGHSRIDVR